ncbi:ATP-grasp domain-containing protein [Nocardiopsis ansamitocini]|uniref:ATP-grasp domain-containing protein n=1 Tax=Nocardiopsis ansamitocini TaxID=1670832 RepID=A0A9W6P9H0_9ACTN|nr:hypothetical protein [Nocardiopsis ansamitocini]GLU50069.1 hypothetical protein Nans01_44200 [Nocardiopsis ansamitocini]
MTSQPTHTSGTGGPATPAVRRPLFTAQLQAAADTLGVRLEWRSDSWIARLSAEGTTRYVIGYHFPVNNAASAQLAGDKAACSLLLAEAGVPAVAHRLLRFAQTEPDGFLLRALGDDRFPVVVKPNSECGGNGVVRAGGVGELTAALSLLQERYRSVAVSPFEEIAEEYRVVMLDGSVRLVFRKVRDEAAAAGEWRHNLGLGAYPEIVDDPGETAPLVEMAGRAMSALDLRLAAVDVVSTPRGLRVLEVNSMITLERFSRFSPEYAERASAVYLECVRHSFTAAP